MSVDGRITIDALFYDRDGATGLNVLSLSDTIASPGGVAASITGTVSVGTISLPTAGYRNAAGQVSYPVSPTVLVFRHTGYCVVTQPSDVDCPATRITPNPGQAVVISVQPDLPVYIQSLTTGTYAAIVYGET